MKFMRRETFMETFELPIARHKAAHELYMAMNGKDMAVM